MKKIPFSLVLSLSMVALLGAGCGEEETSEDTTADFNQSVPVEQGSSADGNENDAQPGENIGDEAEKMDGDSVVDMSAEELTTDASSMDTMVYQYGALLTPSVDGVATGEESGDAMANFEDGTYSMVARFENLEEIDTTAYFYEGWIVRGAAESVISTGELTQEDGEWINRYQSSEDLTDHTRYVLTLEPRDGDPAPADHVVEGTFSDA
jgi:hypothetical protein